MGRGDGDEAVDFDAGRGAVADHVPGVEAAHAVGYDVDASGSVTVVVVAAGDGRYLGGDLGAEAGGAVGDGGRGRDRGRYYGRALGGQGLLDAVPVVDGREGGVEAQLGEAEEAVGEDDGVAGGFCRRRGKGSAYGVQRSSRWVQGVGGRVRKGG